MPLHRRIYDDLRRQILDGRLTAGAHGCRRSRSLAVDLRVSRSTVVQAFGQLRAEGYIESVSTRRDACQRRSLPDRPGARRYRRRGRQRTRHRHAGPASARRGDRAAWPVFGIVAERPPRAFRTSVPALDVFPVDVWGRLMARRWRRSPAAALVVRRQRAACRRCAARSPTTWRTRAACAAMPDQVLITCRIAARARPRRARDARARRRGVDGGSRATSARAAHSSSPARGSCPCRWTTTA